MSLNPSLQRLKRLIKQVPSHDEVLHVLGDLRAKNEHTADRAAAIVGATLIEHDLKVIISTSLVKLTEDETDYLFGAGGQAPLATLNDRIQMAYAMGLIGRKGRADLDLVRRIRILFAHSAFDVHFRVKEVADVCKQFKLIKKAESMSAKAAYIETIAHISGACQKTITKNISYFIPGGGTITHPNPSRRFLP